MTPKKNKDTIASIATPPGKGAIGIVRLSGTVAVDIAAACFRSSRGKNIRNGERVFHGEILDAHGHVLDEVLLHIMRAPRTYTREDVIEINAHGGLIPLQAILDRVLELGARLAQPGEFTRRAFLNGRIDLIQAEAVIDRIQARTHAALRAASAAANGELSRTIHELANILLNTLARAEATVDFPEEDLQGLIDETLFDTLRQCLSRMEDLLATEQTGRLLLEGAQIAFVGRPNVGKSSLFNALLRHPRAIVTPHPGTTRDIVEDTINLNGIPLRLKDMAGLRDCLNEVEKIGVAAARNAISHADAILLIADASQPLTQEDFTIAHDIESLHIPTIFVYNKSDLLPPSENLSNQTLTHPFPWSSGPVFVSALRQEGLNDLESALLQTLHSDPTQLRPDILTRAHQRDSLRKASAALNRALATQSLSPEFLCIDIHDAINALGEITGETTCEDILDRIFSQFCIGK